MGKGKLCWGQPRLQGTQHRRDSWTGGAESRLPPTQKLLLAQLAVTGFCFTPMGHLQVRAPCVGPFWRNRKALLGTNVVTNRDEQEKRIEWVAAVMLRTRLHNWLHQEGQKAAHDKKHKTLAQKKGEVCVTGNGPGSTRGYPWKRPEGWWCGGGDGLSKVLEVFLWSWGWRWLPLLGVHTSLLAMTMANPRPQQTPLRPGLTSAHQASHEVTQLWAPLPSQGCDTQAQSHMQLKGQCVIDRHGWAVSGDVRFASGAPGLKWSPGRPLQWGSQAVPRS